MTRRQRAKRRSHVQRSGAGRRVFLALGVAGLLGAAALLVGVGYLLNVAAEEPSLDNIKPIVPGSTSVVYAADGRSKLGFLGGDELRTPVTDKQIPELLRKATVAIEDRRFFQHHGVDYTGVARATVSNVVSGRTVQGGSTITMQLVRNRYITRERTIQRKLKEARLAEQLERKYPKAWILDEYLNNVPYGTNGGQTAIGVQAAARVYFNKRAADLKLPEAALLAGLPQAPSQYNPFRDPEQARSRRAEVLRRMVEQRMITPEEAAKADRAPLRVEANRYYQQKRANYFFDFVRDQLNRKYGIATVRKGGLKITTTIDLEKQREAEQAIARQLAYAGAPSAAIVTVDPRSGAIKAMATSGSYGDNKFNYAAQGQRQPGSTAKVWVLTEAIRRGIDPDRTTYDSRKLQPGWLPTNPTYEVKTFSNDYQGPIDLVKATLTSDNAVYAQLDADLGPRSVVRTARDMGITAKLNGYPAEGLGGLDYGVSPLEMANAYATLASGGVRNRATGIRKIVFGDGHVERFGQGQRRRAFSDGVAHEVTRILRKNVQEGTGQKSSIGCPSAGKTGTTSSFKDAWFVGYTPRLSTAVWVGYPQPRELFYDGQGMQGGSLPAMLWHDYMSQAHGGFCGDFRAPKHRVSFQPWYGKYSRMAGTPASRGSGSSSPGGQGNPYGPGSGGGYGNGGGGGYGTSPTPPYSRPSPAVPAPTATVPRAAPVSAPAPEAGGDPAPARAPVADPVQDTGGTAAPG